MADIESALISELAANNTAPSPDGLPPNSSPNIVYTQGREALAMAKRAWDRLGPTVTSGGSANAQTLAYVQGPTAYVRGQGYCFIAGFTNTGPMTLNVSGLGGLNVFQDGVALQGGEVRAGLVVEVFYDGITGFQIVSGRSLASIASGLGGSMRNFLINPLFNVQQRGAQNAFGLAVAASTSPYTVDRWYVATGVNEALTVFCNAPVFGGSLGPFTLQVNRNSGQTGVSGIIFGQPFDTDIIQLLAGQQVTISAQVSAGGGFTATGVTMQLLAGTGSPTRTITGFTGSTAVASTGNVAVVPAGAPITLSAAGTVPSTARQLEFRFIWTPVGTAGAADALNIMTPRLNLGPVDLGPDLTRIYTTELPICQRFYAKSFLATTAPAQNVGNFNGGILAALSTGSSGNFGGMAYFPATLRTTAPSLLFYNPSAANGNWRDVTNSADRVASLSTLSDRNFGVVGAGGVAGANNVLHWIVDAEII